MTWRQYPPLTPIIRQGDASEQCYVLLKGVVSVWVESAQPEDSAQHLRGSIPAHRESQIFRSSGAQKGASTLPPRGKTTKSKLPRWKSGGASDQPSFLTEVKGQEEQYAGDRSNRVDLDMSLGGPLGSKLVKVLEEGACFGEVGLLHGVRRNATTMSRDICECGVIQKKTS